MQYEDFASNLSVVCDRKSTEKKIRGKKQFRYRLRTNYDHVHMGLLGWTCD
jgi:hypothetical protein